MSGTYTDGTADHHHDHSGALVAPRASDHDTSARRERRLNVALALNVVVVVAQVIAGILASSLGLIADAGHNITDVAAIIASLVAVRWARRRPTGQRSFGYHRATILAALANAVSILVVTVWIVYEAIGRLAEPEEVEGSIVVIVAVIAAAANLIAALAVRESHAGHAHGASGHDLNMRSAMLHLISDTAASVGVAIAGTVILVVDGAYWLDPLVSMGIGLLIAVQAWHLLRAATDVLLESTPAGLDMTELADAIRAVPGVEQVHDLHAWSLSSEVHALSAHVVVDGHPSLESAQRVGEDVKHEIGPRFGLAHITLELECESCTNDGELCAADDRHRADAGHTH